MYLTLIARFEGAAMNRIALGLLCLLAQAALAAAQQPPLPPKEPLSQEKVFEAIQNNVAKIREVKPFLRQVEAAKLLLNQVSDRAKELKDAVDRRKVNLPKDYRMSLTDDAFALELSAYELGKIREFNEKSTQKVVRRIQAVAADLELKVKNFKAKSPPERGRGEGRGGPPGRARREANTMPDDSSTSGVLVVVTTKDRCGNEVQNHGVWYVAKALDGIEERYERFDQLSSPTKKVIPVGYYLMWTQAPDKTVGDKTPVNPGDDQKREKHVDLFVP
jgi:hypothetical protein